MAGKTAHLSAGCTCGAGEDAGRYAHRQLCRAPIAVAEAISQAAVVGHVGGGLTGAEYALVSAAAYLVQARLGVESEVDLGELARDMIRDAAAEICGEEAGR